MVDSNKIIAPTQILMPDPLTVYHLKPGHELRINRIKDHIKVVLVSGQAEVFGRELPLTEPIFFNHGEEIAIFCWEQSEIKISGELDSYESEQTPMHIYVNINFALHQLREQARLNKSIGPSLLITGAQLTGKSTLAKILTNYSVKLGWKPIFVDLDLNSCELSPPGTISAATISETLPSDNIKEVITFFHGKETFITQEYFLRQVEEMAMAANGKLQTDLNNFKLVYGDEEEMIAPSQPEVFASGMIINGFTPTNRAETETLCKAIKLYNVQVVLVLDHEKLEKDIREFLRLNPSPDVQVRIIKAPKNPGIQSRKGLSNDELQTQLYDQYLDYFRGRYSELFSKSLLWRERIQMPPYLRRDLEPQPYPVPIDKMRIFEVKGCEIPLSALPSGRTQSEWTTIVEYLRPGDFETNFQQKYAGRVLANLKPRDAKLLVQLDLQIAQNPTHVKLSDEFQETLLTAATSEFVQLKEIKIDKNSNKKVVEVIRTCQLSEEEQAQSDDSIGFASNYFIISHFKLKKNVL